MDQKFSVMSFERKGRMFDRFAKTMPIQQTYREIYQNAREAGASKFEIDVVHDPNGRRWIRCFDNGPGMSAERMTTVMTKLGESGHDGEENMGVGARLTAVAHFGEAIFVSRVEGESASSLHYRFDHEFGPVVIEYGGDYLYETEEWEWRTKNVNGEWRAEAKHGSAWLMPVPPSEDTDSVIAAQIARSLRARYATFDDCPVSYLVKLTHHDDGKTSKSQRPAPGLYDHLNKIKSSSGTLNPRPSWTIDWWVLPTTDRRGLDAGGVYLPSCIAVQVDGELFQHAPNLFIGGGNRSVYDKFGLNTKTARSRVSIVVTPPKSEYKMTVDRFRIANAEGEEFDYSEIGLWFAQNMPDEVRELTKLDFKTVENADSEIMAGIKRDYLNSLPKISKVRFSDDGKIPGIVDDLAGRVGGVAGVGEHGGSVERNDTATGSVTTGLDAEIGLPDDDQRRRKGKRIKAHIKPSFIVVPQEEYDEEATRLAVPLYVEPSTGRCILNKDHSIFSDIVEAVCVSLGVTWDVEKREEIANEILNRAGIAAAIRFGVWSGLSREYKMSASVKPSMFAKETFWGGALAGTNLIDDVTRKLRSA